jgi:sulfonate transport system substrate-binding protein
MKFNKVVATVVASIVSLSALSRAEDKPKVIRIGYPGVGVGGRPIVGGTWFAYAANKAQFENEFKKDGIEVKWTYFLQAGPALNEAYANNLLDVELLGDLPSLVGRASGLDYRVVLAGGRNIPTAVVVPADSRITSIEELRGKRVGIFKGTNIQISANRILAAHGLSEKDLRVVNLNGVAQQSALASKDIDAIFTSLSGAIAWGDQGLSRTIYVSSKDPKASNAGTNITTLVSQRFIDKYPSIVQRIVNIQLKAAALQIDPKNHDDIFKEWSKSGTAYSSFKRAYVGINLAREQSPLLDNEIRTIYKNALTDAKKYGLVRKVYDVDAWFEPKFLSQGLKELSLENAWKAY